MSNVIAVSTSISLNSKGDVVINNIPIKKRRDVLEAIKCSMSISLKDKDEYELMVKILDQAIKEAVKAIIPKQTDYFFSIMVKSTTYTQHQSGTKDFILAVIRDIAEASVETFSNIKNKKEELKDDI